MFGTYSTYSKSLDTTADKNLWNSNQSSDRKQNNNSIDQKEVSMDYNDCTIMYLPRELLRYIGSFFNFQRWIEENKIFRFSSHWKNFLNASKKVFQQLKRETQLLELRGNTTRQYFNCSVFRERVNSTIIDCKTQLSLALSSLNTVHNDELEPQNIKSLLFSNELQIFTGANSLYIFKRLIPALPPVVNVNSLHLCGCTIQSSSFFSQVKVLTITNLIPGEINLSDLGVHSLEEFTISSLRAQAEIRHYQALQGAKTIFIRKATAFPMLSASRMLGSYPLFVARISLM
jgi:hypothetical protein